MIDYNEEGTFVIDSAIQNELGSKEEIALYEELSLALEIMEDDSFNVIYSGIGGGIDFGITTPYPHGLPENIGALFFNIDFRFEVNVQETAKSALIDERYFQINIKEYD